VIGAAIIVFREIIEAGLIVGIVLAATQRAPGSRIWIAGGVVAGVLGSCVVAAFTNVIASTFEGFGQEMFNAAILAAAVLMLTWHNIWMAHHGRSMAAELHETSRSIIEGHKSLAMLSAVVGIAVLREGAEVVLFLYGVAIGAGSTAGSLAAGGALGLVLGTGVSFLTYRGLLRIPTRYFFVVTSWLITFLAAGMAAQATAFLEQAGAVTALQQTVWNSSGILPEGSIPGRVLRTLVGYSDRPTLMQLVVYLAALAAIIILTRISRPRPPQQSAVSPVSAE
jgi:high-affinity iron transporter